MESHKISPFEKCTKCFEIRDMLLEKKPVHPVMTGRLRCKLTEGFVKLLNVAADKENKAR